MRSQAHCRCESCAAPSPASVALDALGGLFVWAALLFAVWVLIASGPVTH